MRFWAGRGPNAQEIKTQSSLASFMSQEVASAQNESIRVACSKDGLFTIQILQPISPEGNSFEQSLELWSQYSEYCNALIAILSELTHVYIHENFNHKNLLLISYLEDQIVTAGAGETGFQGLAFMARNRMVVIADQLGVEPISMSTLSIQEDVGKIEELLIKFVNLSTISGATNMISTLTSSCANLSQGAKRDSVVLSWFVIESVVSNMWHGWLRSIGAKQESLVKPPNSRRIKYLKGRDYTISIQSNMLQLSGVLPSDIFTKIDKIRKIRNDVVHDLSHEPSLSETRDALSTGFEVVSMSLGETVMAWPDESVRGFP